MPLSDSARIAAQTPRIIALWRALNPLRSCVSFMNTGAHPDDEISGMLAALSWRDGIDLSYACSTRGEGGQNDIGTEAGAELGALRTAEMEAAAQVLPLRLYWLSDSADDPVHDFGLSKSGVETLAKWGRARTLARFVHILRTERPDIICPTFLDVPGQHGHHRAMTEAAHLVIDLAADPEFSGCDLPVWQVKKLYLPAWSGAGQAYDDALPPQPATLVIPGQGCDPVTGWTWEQIGQRSRVFHATQAMGRWVPADTFRDWPLHLADTRVAGPDVGLTAGLPASLAELAGYAGAPGLDVTLARAQQAMDEARAAFPDGAAILPHAVRALTLIRMARETCPPSAEAEVLHRLSRKEIQLSHLIRIAAGVTVIGRTADDWLRPDETTAVTLETHVGRADSVTVDLLLPHGWRADESGLTPGTDAAPFDAYRDTFLPDTPPAPALAVTLRILGVDSTTRIALETPPVLQPARSATMTPAAEVFNIAAPRPLSVTLGDIHPPQAIAALILPEDWQTIRTESGFALTPPADVAPGLHQIDLTLDEQPALAARRILHHHIAPTLHLAPARLALRVVDVAVPKARIAVFSGGNDRVAHWLTAIGCDVQQPDTTLSDEELRGFDTVVIGIFALKFRNGLAALMPRLRDWVERGGNLLTLYHRPWDNWSAAGLDIEIGQPSLRWRVTDENSAVTQLSDHPLLTTPNAIGPLDWQRWHKERGLYFAKGWGDAYRPLLEMGDPDEAPHRGALLTADIGKGRHTHTSLILHHQLEHLTPGAFRLMANLVTPRG